MKTRIIKQSTWEVIAEYPYPFSLSSNDVVIFNGIEYNVDYCALNIAESVIEICV